MNYTLLERDFEQEILNPNFEILNKSKIQMIKCFEYRRF